MFINNINFKVINDYCGFIYKSNIIKCLKIFAYDYSKRTTFILKENLIKKKEMYKQTI